MPVRIASDQDSTNKKAKTGDKGSQLVCRIKYNNSLPDIPFDPKALSYPFDTNRYVQYNQTSLERQHQSELLTEPDIGVTIDLINPDTYRVDEDEHIELDSEDERLLEEESTTQQDSKRSARHNRTVSWLRKTEYISTEYNRFQQRSDKAESRIGHNLKKILGEEVMYKDRESQIRAIEDGFEKNKNEITKHHSKPGVTPVEILPIFPDFEMWGYPCAQVIFDSDPAPPLPTHSAQLDAMSQALIRGMVDENNEQFVAYFLPTEETLKKRKRDAEADVEYEEEEEYEYYLAREYNWNVKNKLSKGYEETYFFVWRENGIYYNELETRVRLSKRRKLGGGPTNKSRLLVHHRPMTDGEVQVQEVRMTMLEPPAEEEEEEFEGFTADDVGDEGEKSEKQDKQDVEDGEEESDAAAQDSEHEQNSDKNSDSEEKNSGTDSEEKNSDSDSS